MESAVLQKRIADCEEAYLEIFCSKGREWGLFVYQDRQLPDSYSHNFIRIPDHIPQIQYKGLADVARNTARATGRRFLQLQMPAKIEFKHAQMHTVGFYQLGPAAEQTPPEGEWQLRKFTAADAELLTAFALEADAANYGEDFCRRSSGRQIGAYLAEEDLDCWLTFVDGKVAAVCELFVFDGCAKITGLQAAEGGGNPDAACALLSQVCREAVARGAELVYLSIDENDALNDICLRQGFEKCGEYYTALWEFD